MDSFLSELLGFGNVGPRQQNPFAYHFRQREAPPLVYHQKFKPLTPAFWQTDDPTKLECGDKIVVPPSALSKLSRMNTQFPIMFQITNENPNGRRKSSHCSVLEFTAPEDTVYLPVWMFHNLHMDPKSTENVVSLRNVPLQKGTFVTFQPHSSDFTELKNPRALLEVELRKFSCLTKGDTIQITPKGLGQKYLLNVVEVKPANMVSIIETDVRVDFVPPLDAQFRVPAQRGIQPMEEKKEEVKIDSDDDLMGGLLGDEENSSNLKKLEKERYFRKLKDGWKLNGRPIQTKKTVAKPLFGNADGKKNQRIEEIVGKMRYIYEVDSVTGEKTIIRRLPLRKSLTSLGPGHRC